jgi:hypothetical protein
VVGPAWRLSAALACALACLRAYCRREARGFEGEMGTALLLGVFTFRGSLDVEGGASTSGRNGSRVFGLNAIEIAEEC